MGLENRRGAAAHRFHTTKVGALDLPTYLDTNPTPPLASTRSHTSFDFLFTITSFQVGLFFLSFFLFFFFSFSFFFIFFLWRDEGHFPSLTSCRVHPHWRTVLQGPQRGLGLRRDCG